MSLFNPRFYFAPILIGSGVAISSFSVFLQIVSADMETDSAVVHFYRGMDPIMWWILIGFPVILGALFLWAGISCLFGRRIAPQFPAILMVLSILVCFFNLFIGVIASISAIAVFLNRRHMPNAT